MTGVIITNGNFSAHLGYLFTEVPLAARLTLAKAAGFDAVEHPAPFDIPADQFRNMLDDNALHLSQITSGMGQSGEKGIAALPGREVEFRKAYAYALDYAEEAGSAFVHAMAGVPATVDRGQRADTTYRKNIEAAHRLCENRKPKVLVEMISEAAVPGYHMNSFDALFKLADDFPGVSTLVDTYHIAAVGADPVAVVHKARGSLGHIHLADHPGRHEPGTGNLQFNPLLGALADIGYQGAIGFEYIPSDASHLNWIPPFLNDPNIVRLRTANH